MLSVECLVCVVVCGALEAALGGEWHEALTADAGRKQLERDQTGQF